MAAINEASAQALTVRAGTLGPSVGLTTGLAKKLNLRLDVPFFSYGKEGVLDVDNEPLSYDANAKIMLPGAVLDVFPFGNGFRLSGGAYMNRNKYSITARPTEARTVGATTFTPEEVGSVSADITYKSKLAGYVGFGYGNAVAPKNRIGFLFDIGALYTGSPAVAMTATGLLEPTAEQSTQIEENLTEYKWHPQIALGFSIKLR